MMRWMRHRNGVRRGWVAGIAWPWCWVSVWGAVCLRDGTGEKRVWMVIPGRLVRGGLQSAEALRQIVARERIKTIVTLTAINHDDPKYVSQAEVVNQTGVNWIIVPMRVNGDPGAVGRSCRPAGRPEPPAGLLPLRRRTPPDQLDPRGLLDPALRLPGRASVERGRGITLVPASRDRRSE